MRVGTLFIGFMLVAQLLTQRVAGWDPPSPVVVGGSAVANATEISGSVDGRVLDTSGRVVSGAEVSAYLEPVADTDCCMRVGSDTTDVSGRYSIELPAGHYRILVTPAAGTGLGSQWWPGGSSIQRARTAEVGGGAFLAGDQRLPRGVLVSGRTLSSNGRGIAGATVYFHLAFEAGSRSCCEVAAIGTTDSSGRFSVRLPTGTYRVQSVPPNTSLSAPAWYGGSGYFSAQDVVLRSNTSVDLRSQSGSAVQGIVRDAATGDPIADAFVSAYSGAENDYVGSVSTDSSGRYLFPLPSGSYLIQFTPPSRSSYAGQWWSGVTDDDAAAEVSPGHSGIDARLEAGELLTGTVRGGTSRRSVAYAGVWVYQGGGADCCSFVAGTFSDSSGSYGLRLPSGTYRISYEAPAGASYADAWWPAATVFGDAEDITLIEDRRGVDPLLRSGYALSGTITDARTRAAVPDVSVYAMVGGSGASCCSQAGVTVSNSLGSYRVVVPTGTYRLYYAPPAESTDYTPIWWGGAATFTSATDVSVHRSVTRLNVALVSGAAVATVTVSPVSASVTTGKTQQFRASAKDKNGRSITGATVSWSLEPSTLGTISSSGLFRASSTSAGSGQVLATVGGISGSASITVTAATVTISRGGLTFVVISTGRATGYVETSISTSNAQTVMATVDADVKRIESDYRQNFAERPEIWIFGTTTSFVRGLRNIFRISNASQYANASGLYLGSFGAVALNHALVDTDPTSKATIRHELTHAMIGEIIGTYGSYTIPAWLNEGSARLEEFTVSGLRWFEVEERYSAASMAANGLLWSLDDLRSQAIWNSRTGYNLVLQYAVAAQAVDLLREDLGEAGVLRIMQLLRTGISFEVAYERVAGESFGWFELYFEDRVYDLAQRYPGIATASDTPYGSGIYVMHYGFEPYERLTVTAEFPSGATSTRTVAADGIGVYETYVDESSARGTYNFTAYGATSGAAYTSAVKSSGAEVTSQTSIELEWHEFDAADMIRRR